MFFQIARQGVNKWWTYLLTFLLVVAGVILAQVPLALIFMAKASQMGLDPIETQRLLQNMDFTTIGVSQNISLALMLLPFVVGLVILVICVKYIHRRPFSTLITPSDSINWRKILFSFALWMILTICVEIVFFLIEPSSYHIHFQPASFLVLLIISLLLFPLQTSFEELLFRGYFMQGLGLLSKKPIVPLLITSLAFGLMHYMNPEVQEFGAYWAMAYYIGVGLFLGFVTLIDDSLELALGIHAATNVYSALFVTFDSSALQTPALFKTSEVHIEWTLAGLIAAAIIYTILVSRKYNWSNWRNWFKVLTNSVTSNPELS